MNGLILRTLAQQHRVILFARTLNKGRHNGVELTLVILVRCGLDNLYQTVEALKNHLMRRGIVNLGCRSTGALGIDKRIGLGITDRLGKRERLLKVCLLYTSDAADEL